MAGKDKEEEALDCHKCFRGFLPYCLHNQTLETLNKQFHTFRAGHIEAVKLGRGSELQSVNSYHPNKKIAIHEAGHIMAIWFGGSMNSVSCATISRLWTHYHKPNKHITPIRKFPVETLADLFEELCFCLSGRIAESMFFPEEQANFPHFLYYELSDIHKAANVAYYMAKIEHGIKDVSSYISKDVLEDISCYLIRGYQATTTLLKTKAKLLLEIALKLLNEVTINLDTLLTLLGPPKKRMMSLYDQYCAFSMELRPLARKRYSLNKPKRSKKVKKRKARAKAWCNVKRSKKSKALAKHEKKSKVASLRQKKKQETGNGSKKRKRSDSIVRKKRITNDGQVITVFN